MTLWCLVDRRDSEGVICDVGCDFVGEVLLAYLLSARGMNGPVHSVSSMKGWFLACWGLHRSSGFIRSNPLTKSIKELRTCRSIVNF